MSVTVDVARQDWRRSPMPEGAHVGPQRGTGLRGKGLVVICPECGEKGVRGYRRRGVEFQTFGPIVHVVEISAPDPSAQTYEAVAVELCRVPRPDEDKPAPWEVE